MVASVLEEMGVELVEMQFHRGKRSSLRIFIWEPGGITLDRCTEVSRRLSDALDQDDDLIEGRYILEVSSPGTDRPLRTARDFARQIGRTLHITLAAENGREQILEGVLEEADEHGILVLISGKKTAVALDQIKSARVKTIL